MLTDTQRAAYERDGFIVVPEVFSPAEIDDLRRVTDEFVRNAASVAASDEIYDLEDSHSAREPRVRQLKAPHLHHPAYFLASRNAKVVAILKDLWGSVRFDTGKLNMKSAGYGAPVEWHQDWAFYPTPMTISRRSASCSTMSTARTGRCWSCPAATRGRSGTITARTGGFAAPSTRRVWLGAGVISTCRVRCPASGRPGRLRCTMSGRGTARRPIPRA